MTAAVENLITSIRKKNAEEEARVVEQKKQEVIEQAKRQKSLSDQAKKSQGAIDKFISELKGTKKTRDGNVIASRLSGIEKDQLKTLNDQLNSDKQAIASMEQSNRLQELNNKIQQDQTKATREMVLRTRGISEEELQSEEKTRAELKLQKQVLEQMLVSDVMTAEQIKGTREYQEKAANIDRQEKRLENRANRQVRMQNLKQLMTLEGVGKGLEGLKGSIVGLGGRAVDATKNAMAAAGGGLMNMLKVGGLVAAFFGLKAFLDSKLFVQLTEFMKSLAPQFEAIFGGFKKIFQGDIIGGLFSIFKGIAGIVGKILDSAVTAIFNMVARFFGFEGTDSVFGSIANAFMSVVNAVKNAVNAVITTITNVFNSAVQGIKDYFSFSADELGIFGKFIDLVYFPLNLAINFIKDIFKFGDPDKPFRLSQFIMDAVTKVKDFFTGLFSFDEGSLLATAKEKIMNFGRMFKALAAGGIAAVKAILPGGESPAEAFKRVFDETMMSGQMKIYRDEEGGDRAFIPEDMDEVALTGAGVNRVDEVALTNPPIVIQSNQNNSVNSSNTQVNSTAVKSHDEIAKMLTQSHSGSM